MLSLDLSTVFNPSQVKQLLAVCLIFKCMCKFFILPVYVLARMQSLTFPQNVKILNDEMVDTAELLKHLLNRLF